MQQNPDPTPPPLPDQEAWLTVRVRCANQGHAVGVLDKFIQAAGLDARPIDQDNLIYQLQAGSKIFRYNAGSAHIGQPGGGEFDQAGI